MQSGTRNQTWRHAGGLLALLIALLLLAGAGRAGAAPPGPRSLGPAAVPAVVRDGSAQALGPHAKSDQLLILFMLPLRDWAGLNAFLAAAGDPHSSGYRQYLTEAEATDRFGPEAAHATRVEAWLRANGITDVETPADRLYVLARTNAPALDALLGIQIADYQAGGRTFYAPDRPPTLPAAVSADVTWIAGLDSAAPIRSAATGWQPRAGTAAGSPASNPPYHPSAIQAAYDTTPLLNTGTTGAGINVAITLWTEPPSDGGLNSWSSQVGAPVATRGNGRLEIIYTNGSPGASGDPEAALDVESVSGMAPAAHIKYFEANQPLNSNLAHAVDVAGSDPSLDIISNSWGEPESQGARNTFESILALHSASGHTYFFSSGDDGSWANPNQDCPGVDPWPNYPTASAYVVSVGGTAFAGPINNAWPGETTWVYNPTGNQNPVCGNPIPEGAGGGYSRLGARPSWQFGPGVPGTANRPFPDIAADADPQTGYYVCIDSGCGGVGGTSLAAPLWAGMTALLDQYLGAQGLPHVGFFGPTLYSIYRAPGAYPPFHDITSGTNGAYAAGPNWDAVTGIGSPDLWNLARDLVGSVAPTPTPVATPTFEPGQIFSDVPPSHPFFTQINWAYNRNLISGYNNPDGTLRFQPASNATRGQVCKILTLAAGWTIDTSGGPHFSDIAGNPFYSFIETAYHHGVISGYGDGTFRPYANITRGQFAKVVVLAKGWAIDTTGGPHFVDVPTSSPYYGVVETAYHHAIISGYGCGAPGEPCPGSYFRANTNITRGQLAKLLNGAYGP